jgi:hypothetical protein
VLGALASEARVRGPPGRQVPAEGVRRQPRSGLPLPRSGVSAGEGAREVERARALGWAGLHERARREAPAQ